MTVGAVVADAADTLTEAACLETVGGLVSIALNVKFRLSDKPNDLLITRTWKLLIAFALLFSTRELK